MARSLVTMLITIAMLGFGAIGNAGNAATVLNLGTLAVSSPPVPVFFTQSFGPGSPDIADQIVFNVSEIASVDGFGSLFNFGPFNISDFKVSLVDVAAGAVLNTVMAGLDGTFALNFANLVPSNTYAFNFSGIVDGAAGGIYTAGFALTAVPLPPALLLLGSALMGLALFGRLRRRGPVA